MKAPRIVAMLLGSALVGSLPLHGAQAQGASPDLEILAPAVPLPAKERVNLFLEIVNLGPGAARDVAVLVQPADASGLVVIGQVERGLDDLAENDSELFVVRVATPDRAGGASLTFTFTLTNEAGARVTIERTVSVQIAPPTSDPLLATLDARTLEAGNASELEVTVQNSGKRPITNLDLVVETDPSPIPLADPRTDLAPGSTSSLVLQGGTLTPGESARVVVPVLTSLRAEDLILFTLTARYTFDGYERKQTFDFGKRILGSVEIRVLEAREVETGAGLEIAGTIVNVGTGTAWNPQVRPAEGSGLRADGPKLIENLEPNDAVDIRLPVERVGARAAGAPLIEIVWNDDFGELHPQVVEGDLIPLPPKAPRPFAEFLQRLASGWVLVALIAMAAVALAAILIPAVRGIRERREAPEDAEALVEPAEPAEEAAAEPDEWGDAGKRGSWRGRHRWRHRGKPG